jgi:hypothetical protein
MAPVKALCLTAEMAGRPKAAGPSSERVAHNVRRIRLSRNGMTTAALSRLLAAAGQQIADTGITRIEKGDRRVDVDDLVALAVALRCSPARLLLPEAHAPMVDLTATHDITPTTVANMEQMWAWATGERPLGGDGTPDDLWNEATFIQENRPHRFQIVTPIASVDTDYKAQAAIRSAVGKALAGGMATMDVRTAVEQAIVVTLNQLARDGGRTEDDLQ